MARTKAGRSTTQIAPTTDSGVGEWKRIVSTLGGALSLPAGGTWAWFGFYKNDTTNLTTSYNAGVAAGGTEILGAQAGDLAIALAWRVG